MEFNAIEVDTLPSAWQLYFICKGDNSVSLANHGRELRLMYFPPRGSSTSHLCSQELTNGFFPMPATCDHIEQRTPCAMDLVIPLQVSAQLLDGHIVYLRLVL